VPQELPAESGVWTGPVVALHESVVQALPSSVLTAPPASQTLAALHMLGE
jgi:hypothetical protein